MHFSNRVAGSASGSQSYCCIAPMATIVSLNALCRQNAMNVSYRSLVRLNALLSDLSKDARDVVEDDRHHQHEDHRESREEDAFLEFHAEVAAREPFEQDDRDVTAVEDGDGHQVQEPQLKADHRHHGQERKPSELGRLAGHLG